MTNAERCPTCYSDRTWRCTKRRGHTGDHVAYVPVNEKWSEPKSFPQRTGRRAPKARRA